ncbi:MAG: hypothetical protein HC924_08675, partial [Synechococcaceae cyanobacterium SM2_3_2]|nr:hypothetical protein [Synechococcaceae cyanobacterium SM2_3_2]
MPIAINAEVRYRGYDFDILACCGNHILRVKKIHRGIAACVASDKNDTYGIPDRLLWIPVQDLEPLTLSELKQILQPSSPVESTLPDPQMFTPSPGVSMAASPQSQSQQVSAPLPPAPSRPSPQFGIPSGQSPDPS